MRRSKNSGHDHGRGGREDLTEKRRDICSLFFCTKGKKTDTENQKKLYKFTRKQEKNEIFPVRDHGKHKILLEIKVLLGTK